jgi:hypothetical protein
MLLHRAQFLVRRVKHRNALMAWVVLHTHFAMKTEQLRLHQEVLNLFLQHHQSPTFVELVMIMQRHPAHLSVQVVRPMSALATSNVMEERRAKPADHFSAVRDGRKQLRRVLYHVATALIRPAPSVNNVLATLHACGLIHFSAD